MLKKHGDIVIAVIIIVLLTWNIFCPCEQLSIEDTYRCLLISPYQFEKKDKPIPPLLTIDLKPAALIARCLCNNVLVRAVALCGLAFQAPAEDL